MRQFGDTWAVTVWAFIFIPLNPIGVENISRLSCCYLFIVDIHFVYAYKEVLASFCAIGMNITPPH